MRPKWTYARWIKLYGWLEREREGEESTLEVAYRVGQERDEAREIARALAEGESDPQILEKARGWKRHKKWRGAIAIAPRKYGIPDPD